MDTEQTTHMVARYLVPNASLPESDDYDFEAYLDRVVDNLLGPLRQFRSAMLDLGNLMCADDKQRKVFRDFVFERERKFTEIMQNWCAFYHLEDGAVLEAMSEQEYGPATG